MEAAPAHSVLVLSSVPLGPHGGRKAIMSRGRQGFWKLPGWGEGSLVSGARSQDPRCGGPGGARVVPASPPCSPQAALLPPWARQQELVGASLPVPQPRALPGLPSPGPTSSWTLGLGVLACPPGGGAVPARLLHISHRDSIGSCRPGEGWRGRVWYGLGQASEKGAPAPPPPLPRTPRPAALRGS